MHTSGHGHHRCAARVTYTLPSSDTSPGWARYLTDAYLSHDGAGIAREQIDDARVVVSELVTNATRHSSGNCLLRLTVRPGRVTVEVHDDGPVPPVLRELRPDDPVLLPESPEGLLESGRGIDLVRGLSGSFSVSGSARDGKTVQAVLTG